MPPRSHLPSQRPTTLHRRDGRTREARLIGATRRAMLAHLGAEPDAARRLQVERIRQLTLRVAAMDAKFAQTGGCRRGTTPVSRGGSNRTTDTRLLFRRLGCLPGLVPRRGLCRLANHAGDFGDGALPLLTPDLEGLVVRLDVPPNDVMPAETPLQGH